MHLGSIRRHLIMGGVFVAVLALLGAPLRATQPDTVPLSASATPVRVPTVSDRLVPRGWPNRATTGARGELRSVGNRTVTRDGAVLQDMEIRGTLTIRADDVTVRNVRVLADSYYGIITYGDDTVIENTTVTGVNDRVMAGIAAIEGGMSAVRVKVSRVEDGVRLGDNSVLRRSLIFDLRGDPDSHFDGVTADGGFVGWRIIGNAILNPHSQTAAVWVGDERYGPSEGVLSGNFIAGGGYSIYAGPGTGAGIRVVDNVFSTRYFPRSGYWGVSTRWEHRGNTWSDNTWYDGRRKGRRIRP